MLELIIAELVGLDPDSSGKVDGEISEAQRIDLSKNGMDWNFWLIE